MILLPDQLWGNYRLTYEVRLGAKIVTYPVLRGARLRHRGLRRGARAAGAGPREADRAAQLPEQPDRLHADGGRGPGARAALRAQAERGTKLVVVLDDAYFGLFYHLGGASMTESLFGRLANRHPNLLAMRLDGATKELFVWGLRCGFLTFGPGRAAGAERARGARSEGEGRDPRRRLEQPAALADARREGARRGVGGRGAQAEVRDPARAGRAGLRGGERAALPGYFDVYPFNSGYFMCVRLTGVEAETLRVHLLERHRPGLIATATQTCASRSRASRSSRWSRSSRSCSRAIQELREEQGAQFAPAATRSAPARGPRRRALQHRAASSRAEVLDRRCARSGRGRRASRLGASQRGTKP